MTPLRVDRDFPPEDVEAFLKAGYWNDDTLGDWLRERSVEDPDGPQIIGLDGTLTNREVYDHAQRMAGALLSMGIVKGQAVGIQMANTSEFIITYYGIALMGGVLLTMHMPYRAHEMAPLLNHGRAVAVICEPATEKYDAPDTMRELKRVVPTLEHVIVGPGGSVPDDCVSLAEMFQAGPGVEINDPPHAADPVLLCFTSGTAAAPKAVLRNYHSALANGRIYGEAINIDRHDRIMVVPPFSHVFGLCCLHSGLAYGAPTVLLRAFSPELFVEVVERHQPTLLFSSPAPVAATLKSGLLTGDLVSVRQAVLAGSIVPPAA
jgi:acyl-CoA synthetase (AMP-forming)/AMP-acid ligase II